MPGNIAQIEFLLYKGESIESIYREFRTRAADGARMKLVVRIVDGDGAVTAGVLEAKAREEEFDRYLMREFSELELASRPRRWWMGRRRRKLGQRSREARRLLHAAALRGFEGAIRAEAAIGLEPYPGAPFRLARHDELHELREAARRAHGVWAFVFMPNGLLADRNTLVAWAA